MGVSTPVDITPEIEAAFRRFAITPRRIVLISPLRERKRGRLSYRVETEDGRTVKVRQLDSIERARLLVDLRAGLEESFAPVLAHHGPVLLEEWIEGVPLTGLDGEARAEEAGALLGRLHGMPLRLDAPSTFSTRRWNEAAESDMRTLSSAGKLAPAEIASLRAGILRRDPGTARAAVIHKDFCAENMLIDAGGRLRVIDNERLMIGPAGLDLGRTFDRWPMPEASWARFLRGYRSSAPAKPESIDFWKIVAALWGARIRFQRDPARPDAALALLRRFVAGESLSDPE